MSEAITERSRVICRNDLDRECLTCDNSIVDHGLRWSERMQDDRLAMPLYPREREMDNAMEIVIHLPDHPGMPKDKLTGKTQCEKSKIPPEQTSDYYDEVNCINCLIKYQNDLQRELAAMVEIDDKKVNWEDSRQAALLGSNIHIIRQRLAELHKDR